LVSCFLSAKSAAHVGRETQQRSTHYPIGRSIDPSSITRHKKLMGFRYQPPRHTPELRQEHVEARVAFAEQMLAHPGWLPRIHFSDESRFVLGDDKRWVWYRRGEENDSAMRSTQKFPPSVMIFGVIARRPR
jgi:hypothetical protein